MPKISDKLRADRREAILRAALDCLATHGYGGTNMRTIAEAVGLTKGGLYAYFDSKEAILLTLADRYMEAQLERLAPRAGETAEEQLAQGLAYLTPVTSEPRAASGLTAILDLWLSAAEIPAVRASMEARYTRYHAALAALVRRGMASGEFRADADPEGAAGLILAARDGLIFQTIKLKAPVPVPEMVEHLLDAVHAWLAPPERAAVRRATAAR